MTELCPAMQYAEDVIAGRVVAFGWMRADGTRRFRFAYLEIARKNGKTTTAAGVGLYLAFADGEPGAEVYACATKKDQARICHSAANMVKASPHLSSRLDVFSNNISDDLTLSKFEPLGRDSDSTDGLNVSGAVMDELHAWKQRDLSAVIEDDAFFGMIYTLDEGDDPFTDPSCWIKANPNLGVSVKDDQLREAVQRAKESPGAMNSVLRLHFNVWTQAETRWLNIDKWRACGSPIEPTSLHGRRCYLRRPGSQLEHRHFRLHPRLPAVRAWRAV